jgi:hypothetical protein
MRRSLGIISGAFALRNHPFVLKNGGLMQEKGLKQQRQIIRNRPNFVQYQFISSQG